MNITVEYSAQIKRAAGTARETVEVAEDATIRDVLIAVCEGREEAFRRLVLTAESDPQPTLLIFAGDEQVRGVAAQPLADGTIVTLLSPISGG